MSLPQDIGLTALDGSTHSTGDFAGSVLLVVNVASACGLTPQYEGLQRLYETHRDRGLVVLGFPCNQFAGQEPGSAEDIRAFCDARFGVTFPLFAKIDVNGPDRHPLYAWLTAQPTEPEGPGDVKWNFGKFLIGRDGALLARFEPTVEPASPELAEQIDQALGA